MNPPLRVLFLSRANCARSQMAEALLRTHAHEGVEACSAGIHPRADLHPLAVDVMRERYRIDLMPQFPKSLDYFLGQNFDYAITVCDRAAAACPVFQGEPERLHWRIPDPAVVEGTLSQRTHAFDCTARLLNEYIQRWLAQPLVTRRSRKEGLSARAATYAGV